MVRGLVDIDALGGEVERRHEQALAAVAEEAAAEGPTDDVAQRLEAVFGAQQAAQIAGESARLEDARAELLVELQQLAGGQPEPEPDGEDAASRRTGDQVEIIVDRLADAILDLRQERGREDALDAAAIDGQDTPQTRLIPDALFPRATLRRKA